MPRTATLPLKVGLAPVDGSTGHKPSSIFRINLTTVYRAHHSGPSSHMVLFARANIANTIITAIGAAHLLRRRRQRGQLAFSRYKEGVLLSQKCNQPSAEESSLSVSQITRRKDFKFNDSEEGLW